MNNRLGILCLLLLALSSVYGQESQLPYESKIADLGEIQMEYYDHGGSGPLLIEVQDFHNYYEGPYHDPNSTVFGFLSNLSQNFHVVAPMRRGYGKSTDTKWGYDVATLAEDLLLFMDALGVQKAFFMGRFPGSQELTYIAEHHPERVLGLIYYNNPIILVECTDSEVMEYFENISVFTPDFDKEKLNRIMGSRAMWRPDFLTYEDLRINVPAIRFIDPEFEKSNFNLAMFESGEIKLMSEEDWKGQRDEEQQYLKELISDSVRYEQLYEKLKACNLTEAIESGMKRAFGKNLVTHNYSNPTDQKGFEDFLKWQLEHIVAFKEKVMK